MGNGWSVFDVTWRSHFKVTRIFILGTGKQGGIKGKVKWLLNL